MTFTDRTAGTVTFRLGDETVVHDIQEDPIFQEGFGRQYNAVRARLEGATGTVVGYADDVRTASDALTNEEQNAALITDPNTTAGESGSSGGGGSADLSLLMLLIGGLFAPQLKRREH